MTSGSRASDAGGISDGREEAPEKQSVRVRTWVEVGKLFKAKIDNNRDIGDCDRRLGDVGGEDHLALRKRKGPVPVQ